MLTQHLHVLSFHRCFCHKGWNSGNISMSVIRSAKITLQNVMFQISNCLEYATVHICSEIPTGCVFSQINMWMPPSFLKNFLKTSRPRKTFANLYTEVKFLLNIKVEQTLQTISINYHYKKLSKSNWFITSKTWAALKMCIGAWLCTDFFLKC